MKWKVSRSRLKGVLAVPPSKSHTVRALLIASLARGESRIRNPLAQGDGASALRVATSLGAVVRHDEGVACVAGGGVAALGAGTRSCACDNSGTSMTLFTSAAALGATPVCFDGDASLRSRPMQQLFAPLRQLGVSVTVHTRQGDVPFTVQGPLRGGTAQVNGLSSQFVSSLLLSCPLAQQDTHLEVVDLHERPYVEMTRWWLNRQGIRHECEPDLSRFVIYGGQSYHPFDLTVPGDFSSATFGAVAACLGAGGLMLSGLDFDDPQGDKEVFTVLERMGARIERGGTGAEVDAPDGLDGGTFDLNAMPDALPALCVAATVARGTTRLVNVAQARIKECDRIAVMCRELGAMGASVRELPDGIEIRPSALRGAGVCGHGDHRVVMALALAGLIARGETIIDTAESAAVTYPTFCEDFQRVGACIDVVD